MSELLNELKIKEYKLLKATEEYQEALIKRAKTEKEYRTKLFEVIVKLRIEGYENEKGSTGAIAISACESIARGHPDVINLRFARDIAEAEVNAIYERINTLKYNIKALEMLIIIEYNLNKRQ